MPMATPAPRFTVSVEFAAAFSFAALNFGRMISIMSGRLKTSGD